MMSTSRFPLRRTDIKFDVVIFKRIFMSKVNKAPLTCAKMVSGYQSRYPSLPPQSTTSRRGGGGRVRGKAAPPRPTGAARKRELMSIGIRPWVIKYRTKDGK
ncbi:hypothetical protein YC2023_015287 [Brassica napus]